MAVPTPVDKDNTPDLRPLENACISIGHALRVRASSSKPLIVFESTVYPGCTEDYCVPIIENESGLTSSKDFTVGYSPERVNPGDTEHTLSNVIKIVSGQDHITCERLANLYSHVAKSGVHKASSIKTAEAAKVIENIQRDLNIALMNELAFLFNELGIETSSVLEAASTKWNFLQFKPGIVGGHCIPVDPYYLTYIAKLYSNAAKDVKGSHILILGATYKENVKDFRNTPVVELNNKLITYGANVVVYDPLASSEDLEHLGLKPAPSDVLGYENSFDCLILAVPHKDLAQMTYKQYVSLLNTHNAGGIILDIKGVLKPDSRDDIIYWRL